MSSWLIPIVILIPVLIEGRYIYTIIKGKTKPSFVAYFIFAFEMSVMFCAAYALGARDSLFLIGTFTILHGITALLALKYGYVSFSKFNLFCLALSLCGLLLWWFTSNPWYALLIQISVDTIGFIVLSRKLYICPETEDSSVFFLSTLAYGLNLVIITAWVPQEYLFSMTNMFWCSVIFLLSLRKIRHVT